MGYSKSSCGNFQDESNFQFDIQFGSRKKHTRSIAMKIIKHTCVYVGLMIEALKKALEEVYHKTSFKKIVRLEHKRNIMLLV